MSLICTSVIAAAVAAGDEDNNNFNYHSKLTL